MHNPLAKDSLVNDQKKFSPSTTSIIGLNGLLFFISDIRHGIGPLFSIHLRHTLQWDPAKIGIALAAVEFSAFLSQIPAGLWVDASKRKRSIILSACALIIFGCLMILAFTQFSSIIIAQIFMGISVALISPSLGGITLGLFGRKKFPERVGKNEVWNHCGNVFTALTVGSIAYFLGTQWMFFLLIGFAFASISFLCAIRPNEIDYAAAREEDTKKTPPISITRLLRRKSIIIFNISLFLYFMSNGAQMALIGQILTYRDPMHSSLLIAACMIIAELVMIFTAYFMSRIVNHFNRKTLFLIAFSILPMRAIFYTLVESTSLFLLIQTLDGVAAGIFSVIGVIINADLAINTGRFNFLQGVGAMSIAVGEASSQLFAGIIAKFFGFNLSFFSLAFIGLFGILFFSLLMPETKKMDSK